MQERLCNVSDVGSAEHERSETVQFESRAIALTIGSALHEVVLHEQLQQAMHRARWQTQPLELSFRVMCSASARTCRSRMTRVTVPQVSPLS